MVVANNQSNHADNVGVYVAFLPPGGVANPGGCAPIGVQNLGVFNLLAGEKISIKIDPPWACANPGAVNGLTWTIKALADIHNDDFASCATVGQAFNGTCSAGLANDDDDDTDNVKTRSRPIVVDISP